MISKAAKSARPKAASHDDIGLGTKLDKSVGKRQVQ